MDTETAWQENHKIPQGPVIVRMPRTIELKNMHNAISISTKECDSFITCSQGTEKQEIFWTSITHNVSICEKLKVGAQTKRQCVLFSHDLSYIVKRIGMK